MTLCDPDGVGELCQFGQSADPAACAWAAASSTIGADGVVNANDADGVTSVGGTIDGNGATPAIGEADATTVGATPGKDAIPGNGGPDAITVGATIGDDAIGPDATAVGATSDGGGARSGVGGPDATTVGATPGHNAPLAAGGPDATTVGATPGNLAKLRVGGPGATTGGGVIMVAVDDMIAWLFV